MSQTLRQVLYVEHRGEAKIVGKLFWAPLTPEDDQRQGLVFLHEESGNQWHHQTDSPGGYDRPVLAHLAQVGVVAIHHHKRAGQSKGVYVARLETMLRRGSHPGNYDARDRLYLGRSYWRYWPRGLWYKAPWISQAVTLQASERAAPLTLDANQDARQASAHVQPQQQYIRWGH